MAFSDEVVEQAWTRAGGKCECRRTTHEHTGRCNKTLSWENHGCANGGWGAWEAHHRVSVDSGGSDTLSNCEILCCDCHQATF